MPLITCPFDDTENIVEDCEYLINTGFQWVEFFPSERFPSNAVVAGTAGDGTKQYIGRTFIDNTLTPGRISADTKLLFVAFKGEELIRDFGFEILVNENEPAELSGAPSPVARPQTSRAQTSNSQNAGTSKVLNYHVT